MLSRPHEARTPARLHLGTLRLALPVGRTGLTALLLLVAFAGVCELLARSRVIRSHLPSPIINGHYQIARKLELLDSLQAREGSVDCIFVGSSAVLWDISPEVFARAYQAETGRRITCFNFGLAALNVTGAGRLSEILSRRYRPRLIVYGTSLRDYIEDLGFELDIPWARHQLGDPSVKGWLDSHSASYRHYLALARLPELRKNRQYRQPYFPFGNASNRKVADVLVPPNRDVFPTLYDAMARYQVSAEALVALRRLLSLRGPGRTVALVEMPLPSSVIQLLPNGERDYQAFLDRVGAEAEAGQARFWSMARRDLIPPDGWHDHVHMNWTGAQAFSDWLGRQVGRAVRERVLALPVP